MGDKSPKPSEEYSNSTQDVWGPQAGALEGLYDNANQWYKDYNPQIQDASVNAANTAQGALAAATPTWLQNLQGGNLAGYNIAGGLGNSLSNSMGNPTQQQQAYSQATNGGQNYSDAYRQNFVDDARTAMDTSMQGIDARAAAAGAGGSAYGNAMARGYQDINSNLQSNLANVGYQDYNNQVQNQMQIGAAADSQTLQQQQLLQSLTQQQQGTSDNAFNSQQQVEGYSNAQMQALLNSAGGIEALQKMLGNPTSLTQQASIANGSIPGANAVSGSIGTGGANLSF